MNEAVGRWSQPTEEEIRRGADALRDYYRNTPRRAVKIEDAVRAILTAVQK